MRLLAVLLLVAGGCLAQIPKAGGGGGGGGGGSSTIVQVSPNYAANCVNAVAGSAWDTTLTAICIAGTNNKGGALPFTDADTAQFSWEIPGDWDGTEPYVNVLFQSNSNTTGTVIFNIAIACYKTDGTTTTDAAFATADTLPTKTMAAATRGWSTSIRLTQVTSGNSCVAGGMMRVKVTRATDTAAAAIWVTAAPITAQRTNTFQAN